MVSQDGRNSIGLGALPDVGDPGKPGSVCESHTPATRLLREDPRCECDTHRQSQPPSLCYPRPRPIDRSGHSPWRSPCRQVCPRRHLAHEFGDHDPIKPMLFLGLGANSGVRASFRLADSTLEPASRVSEFRCQSIFSPGGLYARASISCRQASVPKLSLGPRATASACANMRIPVSCEFRCRSIFSPGGLYARASISCRQASVPKRCPSAQGRLRMRARTCEFRCQSIFSPGGLYARPKTSVMRGLNRVDSGPHPVKQATKRADGIRRGVTRKRQAPRKCLRQKPLLEFCILSERKAYRLPDRPFGDRNARRNSGASRQVDHVII